MDTTKQATSAVEIDELNLDKECIRLPSDYLQFAHLTAECKRKVDEVKARLDVVQAELSKDIRANPSDYDIEKVTETAISGAITIHPKFQKAQKELLDARHESEMAQAVVWALEHKKRTLTLLVELHGLGYFSSPKVSKEGREVVDGMTKKSVRKGRFRD